MKKIFTQIAFVALALVFMTACTKQTYIPGPTNEQVWMSSHEKGTVSYVDGYTGNYIVETYQGYSVVQSLGGVVPRQYDSEYAFFSNVGSQAVYNYEGNYYTRERVVESWLSWSDALIVLDNVNHGQ